MKLVTNNNASMNSQQIAELTNKRHDNVKRTIETLFNKGIINRPQIEVIKNDRNQDLSVFIFEGEIGKRDSIIVVAQIMPEVTAILVDRWAELEKQLAEAALPTTYLEALKALISSEEQKQVIQHQLEAAAPKINHYDTVVERFNLMTATQVGQKLGMTANKLNKHLESLGAYNKSVKRGRAFKQWFIDEGYGVMKEANKGYSQALITSKGQAYIVQELTFNKAVPEADIERIEARTNHTANAIQYVNNLLEY